MKRCLIGGNWKCNGTVSQIEGIVKILNDGGDIPSQSEVVIAVPALHITRVQGLIRNEIEIASEDCGLSGNGAYTGEHSAEMLKDAGVKWTLTGHSERRTGFGGPGETSETVAKKTSNAINAGMSVIVCIGEQLAERESGATMDICIEQLAPVIAALKVDDWNRIVIAYEPVWAIGTGKVATPEQAEETHAQIREHLRKSCGDDGTIANNLRIIYGGSVNGKNCAGLISCANIDGFLVGGASLKPEFNEIIRCTA
jgi:triosephosphate isomerase (TIM)